MYLLTKVEEPLEPSFLQLQMTYKLHKILDTGSNLDGKIETYKSAKGSKCFLEFLVVFYIGMTIRLSVHF